MGIMYYAIEIIVLIVLAVIIKRMCWPVMSENYQQRKSSRIEKQKASDRLVECKSKLGELRDEKKEVEEIVGATKEIKEIEEFIKVAEEEIHHLEGKPM